MVPPPISHECSCTQSAQPSNNFRCLVTFPSSLNISRCTETRNGHTCALGRESSNENPRFPPGLGMVEGRIFLKTWGWLKHKFHAEKVLGFHQNTGSNITKTFPSYVSSYHSCLALNFSTFRKFNSTQPLLQVVFPKNDSP